MGRQSLLQLNVKILANLQLTVCIFLLWPPEICLRLIRQFLRLTDKPFGCFTNLQSMLPFLALGRMLFHRTYLSIISSVF